MPSGDLATWRRDGLAELSREIVALRKLKSVIHKACGAVKSTAQRISKDAERRFQEYERILDEIGDEDEDYYEITDLKGALEAIVDLDDYADDADLQTGSSLDTLIEQLEELRDSVRAVET